MTQHDSLAAADTRAACPEGAGRGLPAVSLALLAVFAWAIGWYWPTATDIAAIWWRSETFAHGLVVLPICAWLVWRKRGQLAGLSPQPIPWLALPVAVAGFGWMLGQMVSVNALAHVALVKIIVLSSIAVLGWRLARILAFPLLFLYFGAPIGEFLMPMLMDHTADFTVFALRLSGVPVYQEGLHFVVPNGRWSVVEACSGIRYLIASLMVGSLYAYLSYRSLTRRLVFVGVAIAVPIVANWLRAYLIVMLGYLSDNEIAAGVDHLIYGWLFFGVVILAMFWIGNFWREDDLEPAAQRTVAAAQPIAPPRRWLGLAPLALAIALFPPLHRHLEAPVEPFEVALAALSARPGWSPAEAPLDYRPNFNGQRGELQQGYRREDGAVVGLYVAYYAQQRQDVELVAWGNRLVGERDERWIQLTSGRDALSVGPVRRALLGDGPRRLAVWHWYWSNGRIVASDAVAKALLALDHLTGQPDDAALVAVFAEVEQHADEARPLIEAFLENHAQDIEIMLKNAEARR